MFVFFTELELFGVTAGVSESEGLVLKPASLFKGANINALNSDADIVLLWNDRKSIIKYRLTVIISTKMKARMYYR